jgi:hypothetical protein
MVDLNSFNALAVTMTDHDGLSNKTVYRAYARARDIGSI